MPDMTPVAAGIVPPDPTQGINTFSGILGIKQRQQNLQTGAYTQASAQATASQDQQKNSELQAAQSLVFNGSKSGKYTKADGSLDRQKMADDIATVAPTYGGTAATSLLSQANEIVSNQKAHQELSGAMQKQMGNTFASLASKKDLSNSDVVDAFEELRAANPAPEFSRMLTSMSTHLPPNASPQDLQALMGKWSAAATGEGQQAPSTMDTGGQVQPGTTNRFSGAFTPSGKPVNKTLAPQVVNLPSGSLGVMGGAAGTGAAGAAPAAAPPQSKLPAMTRPAANAPAADQDQYKARVKQLGDEYQAVSQAASDPMNGVQATRFRNQSILDLSQHADTGPGMHLLNTLASRLPGSTGDAYQDLEHYTAQNSAAMAKLMGVPGTNLGQETAAAAAGSVEKNPGALREITRTNDALNTAMSLYNRGLAKVTNNGSDMTRAAAYKQEFGKAMDVNALRWSDAHRRGDQEEIAQLTQKLGQKGIADAQKRLAVLSSLANKGDLP